MCDIGIPAEGPEPSVSLQDGEDDLSLVRLAQSGDMNALEKILRKYAPLVHSACRDRFLPGADAEDLIQEGMIGILSAVRSFACGEGNSFSGFAALCVRRRIDTAVKMANRKKHEPLNSYLPFQAREDENGTAPETEFRLPDGETESPSPEEILLRQEEEKTLYRQLETFLSATELKVLTGLLEGLSYGEIAASLGINEKAVDNARQRIRNKLLKNRFRNALS